MQLMKPTQSSVFLTALFLLFILPLSAGATTLVNINTADLATLETLPGVGASIAQSIIDNRPYVSTSEVSKASGIGDPGSSSYEKIINLITIDGQTQTQNTQQTQTSTTSDSQTQTQTQPQPQASGSLPPQVTAEISLEGAAIAGGGATFGGAAFDADGDVILSGVRYMWNFGDGATADGQRVQHTYAYPGTYDAVLTVAYNYSSAQAQLTVTTTQPAVTLTVETDGSLTVVNKSSDDLDIGGWTLTDGAHTFMIPADTTVLAGGGVRFAPGITGVVGGTSDVLLYPNGTRAASATPGADSPLHGQQIAPSKPVSQSQSSPVAGASVQQVSLAPAQIENTDEQPDLSAAAAQSPVSSALPLWLSIGGLLVLVILGGGAVWYLQTSQASPGAATSPEPEEFDIE